MVTIRRALVASGLVMAVVATGCSKGAATSGSVGTSDPATTATTVLTDADLQPMLLTVDDMPTGWSIDTTDSSNSSDGMPKCLQELDSLDTGPSDASAEAKFIGSASGLPAADETIGPFGPGAPSTFDQATAFLDSCSDVSFDSDGQHISGTMGKMAFPAVGDQSAAWRMSYTVQGLPLTIDVVLARQGDLGVLVSAAYFGTADPRFLQTMTTKALSKLPASA